MNRKSEPRTEADQFGTLQIPAGAYWGCRTARAKELWAEAGSANPQLVDAFLLVKKASASANQDLGKLEPSIARTIGQAADEALNGQWRDQFVIDAACPGSVKGLNDNVNEFLANRSSEILSGQIGAEALVQPDRHVNMHQADYDVYSSAARLAILAACRLLEPCVIDLERLLRRKALEFDKVVKVGRSHLVDTAPVTLGQEFNAYGSSIERASRRVSEASTHLLELGIGGMHVGSGLGADPAFGAMTVERLARLTPFKLRPAEDQFRVFQSMSDFVEVSSSLRELAVDLIKIASDLRLLSSGPSAGLAELRLPAVLPEPSPVLPDRLPARAAPFVAECVSMVSFQVIGNDTAVVLAAQAGQLEVNAMLPVITANILASISLLRRAILVFNQRCVSGIICDTSRCRRDLEESRLLAPALAKHLDRQVLFDLLDECGSSGKSLREVILERSILPIDILEKALQDKALAQPGVADDIAGDTGHEPPQ